MPNRSQREIERRDARGNVQRLELRAIEHGPEINIRAAVDEPSFEGYASTFWHVDSYGTAFVPDAWKKTLTEQKPKVKILWQHWTDQVLGSPTAMAEDGFGLRVSGHIIPTTLGKDVMELLRGNVGLDLSVGFRTIRERPATDADPLILGSELPEWVARNLPGSVYVIEEARLFEFSVVTFPANLNAEIDTVRRDAVAQALSQTLEDLRAGHLDEAGRALIAEIVAAWQAAPESTAPPRTNAQAPRDLLSELTVTLAEYGYPLEHVA